MAAVSVCHFGFVVRVWSTHEQYLVVFLAVHSLVGIDAVVRNESDDDDDHPLNMICVLFSYPYHIVQL